VSALLNSLLHMDSTARDITVHALGILDRAATARIIAHEVGIVAGIAEFVFLYKLNALKVTAIKHDGDAIHANDVLLTVQGTESRILSLERTGLNLLQRMSGIATATHLLQERALRAMHATSVKTPAHHAQPCMHVVATRKTPWGLLDKRAVHLGGGGTHRLGLGDAILIKNNHLALLDENEAIAAELAIEKAWQHRDAIAFIEVEVRSAESALAAARAFKHLQVQTDTATPCLVLLDNLPPAEITRIVKLLRDEQLWDAVLIESSGGITDANFEDYAHSGVDAISIGALTHSVRALDISQKLE